MKLPFFTIGHSNRSLEEFVEMLGSANIALVVDIRTIPQSRANPQFNQDTLAEALAPFHISYEHIPALGGLRGRVKTVPSDINGFWMNEHFHNYADYALSAQFHTGLEHLLEEGHKGLCSMMCSEAVWWRCHRRIVADYLIARQETVLHIMGLNRFNPARLTPGAVIRGDATVVYPSRDGRQGPSGGSTD